MLEKLKKWMQRRIEKHAVYSEIEGESVILKKSKIPILGGEWRQIHPPVDKDNKWNIGNAIFGGWRNFVRLILLMLLLSYGYYSFTVLLGDAKDYMDGRKYVIIEKNAFDKFCKSSIIENNAGDFIHTKNWSDSFIQIEG